MDIFLAVTLYNDQMFGKCSEAINKNCIKLMEAGHKVTPCYNSDLYIDRSRNLCSHLFLNSGCSDIVFIDADMSFDDDAVLKIIEHDKDICAGAYRYKKTETEYTMTLDFSRNNNCKEESTGLVHVERAATGLMKINRSVFDRMITHYGMVKDERGIYPFFETGMIFSDDNNWYGEDTAFCKKWTEMGGDIFVSPDINISHFGTMEFKGNLHEFLMGRRIENLDEVDSGIKGWMTDEELIILQDLASKSKDIVEVGCWKGRSTKVLLETFSGTVYAVDHFLSSENDLTELASFGLDIYNEFMKNVGHFPNLKVLRGNSVDIAKEFDKNVDMVFIDAGHEYEEVKADIEAWLPKCNKIICGHDYSDDHPGVMKAVKEKFHDHGINVNQSIWWVEL
jgi:precorrin-6B methylase 2